MLESKYNFWKSALLWKSSVSPKVVGRVLFFTFYSIGITYLSQDFDQLKWPLGPLEVSGAVIGLLLIVRTNAGYDRWWEARKLWGGIVNQSRNLAIAGLNYGPDNAEWKSKFISEVIKFPKLTIRVLRENLNENSAFQCSNKIAGLNSAAFKAKLISGFEFEAIETQRYQLVDYLGACERILKSPLPTILDIKVRRFLLLYLLLVPFGIVGRADWYTPIIMLIVSYSVLALDQIGIELQNPFSKLSLGALPLDDISNNIEKQILLLPNLDKNLLKTDTSFTTPHIGTMSDINFS